MIHIDVSAPALDAVMAHAEVRPTVDESTGLVLSWTATLPGTRTACAAFTHAEALAGLRDALRSNWVHCLRQIKAHFESQRRAARC